MSFRWGGSTRWTRHVSTLAEYLGASGYATAGFVANTMFCASDTGLGRGFTHYEDFIFPEYTALKTAVLVNRVLAVFGRLLPVVEERPSLAWLRPYVQRAWQSLRLRSQGGGDRQPRVPRMAVTAKTAGAAVFRFLELLRCPHPL